MSRYLYKKIQNISPELLNFQHSELKLTTLGSDPSILQLSVERTVGGFTFSLIVFLQNTFNNLPLISMISQ